VVGPQIDHVLATKGIEASSFRVVDLPGSDHHAILTTLQLP
jgi:endonuclease/exonuclease/phosphatase family metal-dependent hydrolase